MSEPTQHKPMNLCRVAVQHRYFLEFYWMCCQESLSLGWLAGTTVRVLSVREDLEQLTARSCLALRKACAARCLLSSLFCCVWMTSLVLEVVVWSFKGEGEVRRHKYSGRQSEMVRLRNKNVKNLDFLLFILSMCAGLAEKWVGRLN